MAKQAINTARRRIRRSLQTHDHRVALKFINTTRRRNNRVRTKGCRTKKEIL